MTGLLSTLSTIWRLAAPYFRSEDRWRGRVLLATVIAIELSIVAITVLLNHWYNSFYNSLQQHQWEAFVRLILYFCALAGANVVLSVYQLYLNQWLQIRWRRWMTREYLDRWLDGATHYRMQLLGDAADNPDQRISEDIREFISSTLTIGLGLLNAVVTLASFVAILWGLSAAAPFRAFGINFAIPGYLVWGALIYAVFGTVLTHLIGWPLARLNFNQQRFEADFRFNLVRVRENSEQIALLGGEGMETQRLLTRFGNVVTNWYGIMSRQKRLLFFTTSYTQAAIIFPYILAAPAYFAGLMELGGLMQTGNAFRSLQEALSFFVSAYRNLAEWRAMIQRLEGFERSVGAARAVAVTPPRVKVAADGSRPVLAVNELKVGLPNGTPLVVADDLVIRAGERTLVTGPSGAGKSTLFRAIAGIWPFGSGTVVVPRGATLMILPQRPYFPLASLEGAVSYPSERGAFAQDRLAEVLAAVGLAGMVPRIAEEQHWNRMLSLGEQQRLGIARAILHAPDYLFLDEATASLDEPAEADLYRLLQARLPHTTLVSIGHRSTLGAFHDRRLKLVPDGNAYRIREAAFERAAE